MGIEPGKLPVDRGVKEGFFHALVGQIKPLLHAVDAHHGLQGKGWTSVLTFRVIRGNELDQSSPGNHQIHLGQQFLLSRFLCARVQVKAALLHAAQDAMTGLRLPGRHRGFAGFS